MSTTLDVYLCEEKVGQLVQNDNGQLTFSYDARYISGHAPIFPSDRTMHRR